MAFYMKLTQVHIQQQFQDAAIVVDIHCPTINGPGGQCASFFEIWIPYVVS